MSANPQALSVAAASAAASLCTPPASTPSVPADVVAHGTGSGGECPPSDSLCKEDLGHSYFWREAFLTEPVGRWVCAGGHSLGWSLKRSDESSLNRVERRV